MVSVSAASGVWQIQRPREAHGDTQTRSTGTAAGSVNVDRWGSNKTTAPAHTGHKQQLDVVVPEGICGQRHVSSPITSFEKHVWELQVGESRVPQRGRDTWTGGPWICWALKNDFYTFCLASSRHPRREGSRLLAATNSWERWQVYRIQVLFQGTEQSLHYNNLSTSLSDWFGAYVRLRVAGTWPTKCGYDGLSGWDRRTFAPRLVTQWLWLHPLDDTQQTFTIYNHPKDLKPSGSIADVFRSKPSVKQEDRRCPPSSSFPIVVHFISLYLGSNLHWLYLTKVPWS